MKLTWKERFRGLDVAVDLGTARTRVFVRGRGLVADEASAVLFEGGRDPRFPAPRGKVLAVGDDAPRAAASGAGELVRPVADGCLHDPEAAAALLAGLLRKAGALGVRRKDRTLLAQTGCGGAPEREAATNVALRVCAREVVLIEAPMAAMIGTGEDVTDGETRMVFDVGAGVAEAAIVRNAGIVHCESLRLGAERIRPDSPRTRPPPSWSCSSRSPPGARRPFRPTRPAPCGRTDSGSSAVAPSCRASRTPLRSGPASPSTRPKIRPTPSFAARVGSLTNSTVCPAPPHPSTPPLRAGAALPPPAAERPSRTPPRRIQHSAFIIQH